MNESGKAVKYWMNKEKVPVENILVIVDELALPLTRVRRLRPGGALPVITGSGAYRSRWGRRIIPGCDSGSAMISPGGGRWTMCWEGGKGLNCRWSG